MANITFDPANKGASLTLSNLNLTAAVAATALQGVFGTNGQTTGKYYFEYTFGAGTVAVNSHYLGLSLSSAVRDTSGSLGGFRFIPQSTTTANLNFNGATSVSFSGLTAMGSGTVVCFAVDMDNQRVWCRVGAAGNWNASGTATPATPSTGVSFASLGVSGISLIPHIYLATTNTAITANFGDSAFTGTVPTGFTSGFPTGGINNALFTQEVAEVWGAGFPSQAQFTQEVVEVWRTVADAAVVIAADKPMVMVLA